MRVVFLGPPGAGKSTRARELAREWGVPRIATGDMLREAVATDTSLGRAVRNDIESGTLVPDEAIIGLVADRLVHPDAGHGFLLEGFPRTIAQAQALDRLLEGLGQSFDRVVNLEVSEPELLRRLTARQREDDSDGTIRKRLEVYARQTAPLLEYYRARGLLDTVSGEDPIEAVRRAIRKLQPEARRT